VLTLTADSAAPWWKLARSALGLAGGAAVPGQRADSRPPTAEYEPTTHEQQGNAPNRHGHVTAGRGAAARRGRPPPGSCCGGRRGCRGRVPCCGGRRGCRGRAPCCGGRRGVPAGGRERDELILEVLGGTSTALPGGAAHDGLSGLARL